MVRKIIKKPVTKLDESVCLQACDFLCNSLKELYEEWQKPENALDRQHEILLLRAVKYADMLRRARKGHHTITSREKFKEVIRELNEEPGGYDMLSNKDIVVNADQMVDTYGSLAEYYMHIIIGINVINRRYMHVITKYNIIKTVYSLLIEAIEKYAEVFEMEVLANDTYTFEK